jgi:hypothetical protein
MIEKPAEHHSQNDLSATVAPDAFDFRGYESESAMVSLIKTSVWTRTRLE